MSTVVIVAHSDDETLWAGGFLSNNPGTDVICCSVPAKDPIRVKHFFEACRLLRANPIVCAASLAENENKLELLPVQLLAMRYDTIITHNEIGEYGHPHHIQVHKAMKAIRGRELLCFGYGLTTDGDPVDINLKRRVLSVYTSRPQVFERQSKVFDLSKEAFL